MKLTNLNFHQTFPPDADMLSRLLTADVFDEALTKEEISQRTGIPTGKSCGKVEPHIKYATFMGLVEDQYQNGKHTLARTALGELITSEDPGMCEDVTRLVCHLRIVSPFGGAPLWVSIMSEMLPLNPRGISPAALLAALKKETEHNINMSPFYSSYDEELFAPLDLLERSSESIALNKHSVDTDLIYVYAYALFREWEIRFPNHAELTADELSSFLMPGSIGWRETELYSVLEMLQDKGLLNFNRQLAPYTIIKKVTSDFVIPRLYSELF